MRTLDLWPQLEKKRYVGQRWQRKVKSQESNLGLLALTALQKHLGYFNHIFRLSELHQCDQEMLIGRFS